MGEEQDQTSVTDVVQATRIELLCQILGCSGACLLLYCPDDKLRHPLLKIWTAQLPILSVGILAQTGWEGIECEVVEALCDLAAQSGRMQVLPNCPPALARRNIQSLAAVSLECPAGLLGILLLADEQAQHFGEGEQHLLHTYLPIYTAQLEEALLLQAQRFVRENRKCRNGSENENQSASQFIKSDFVAMIGHELRAPLSIIKGYTGLLQIYGDALDLQKAEITPEGQQHYLAEIMEQTHVLEVLINDLLDVSRLQRGKLALRTGAVDISTLCQQVIRLGQMRADQLAAGKHRLICKLAKQLPPLMADRDRLRQVLLNILENAMKYSPDGGTIELEACLSDDSANAICLAIRDSGIGIPERQSEHLFQAFERLERPEIAHIPGSGLGLYIASKLVEAMTGHIEIQSGQNAGTTVLITLPTVKKPWNSSCVKENSLL